MLSVSSTINIESRARRVTKDASCSRQHYANVKFKTSDGTMFVIIWSFVIEHEVMMAVLQDFGYSQAFFNYLDMCSNHTIKNEERKACLFDVDDFVNFPRGVPSTVVKSEPAPQFCRLPTPYSQPYPFAAARPGNYYDQFLYSKFTSMFVSNIAFSSSYLEETSIRISDLRSTWKTKRQIFRNCFTLVFVCKLLFAHSLFTSFFSLQKTTFFLANSDVIGFLWNRKIIFYLRENISVVKIYSSTVVLRRCFDDATRHPGPKKEKKTFSFSTFEYFKLFS